jgi:hypothetical protein
MKRLVILTIEENNGTKSRGIQFQFELKILMVDFDSATVVGHKPLVIYFYQRQYTGLYRCKLVVLEI